jgi:uncharacterized membrane protein
MSRIRSFDWLRGFAVLVMIQTHARGLLAPSLRQGEWYHQLDRIDGLVAPAFLLTAGFAMGLTQMRGATFVHSLRRVVQVLGVATLVNCIWFRVWLEPIKLLRLDILHCVALSLLGVLVLLSALRHRPRVALLASVTLAGIAFAVAPLVEMTPVPLSLLLSERSGALFPLVPWSGYVFLGCSGGIIAGSEPQRLPWWMAAVLVLGLALKALSEPLRALYPAHAFLRTNPSMAGERLALVAATLLVLHRLSPWLERRRTMQFVRDFGTQSLAAYFFHEMLLFQRRLGPLCFENHFQDRADWPTYWLLVAALIFLTYGCCLLFEKAKSLSLKGKKVATSL